MDAHVYTSLASEGIDLSVDLWEAQPCLWTQNDIVVGLITLRGIIKVY